LETQVVSRIIFELFIIFLVAKITAELFERIKQPVVIGELLAGIIIGPSLLGLIGNPSPISIQFFEEVAKLPLAEAKEVAKDATKLIFEVLAELGVIVLLFSVGLETNLNALIKLGGRAMAVAIMGVIFPFVLGAGLTIALNYKFEESLFIGAAMVATSVGITARVLRDIGKLQTAESRIILGAAVIDDVLGILVLTVVLGISKQGVSVLEIAGLIAVSFGFLGLGLLIGVFGVRRISIHFDKLHLHNPAFAISLIVCLGLAAAASQIGLAAIIGAFLAGLIFSESTEQKSLEHAIRPVFELLVPVFFVITGSKVQLSSFTNGSILTIAAAITVLAILGKFIGCGLAALSMGKRSAAIIGIGMAPRGEVGLIVASIGLTQNVFTPTNGLYSVVVVMSIVTTVIVPPILSLLFKDYGGTAEKELVESKPLP
jgi:Kef-type K+ transport system membrane component KefB